MTDLSDHTLLAYWYRQRNAEAFQVLATRHARMVYATALRILRNAHDAEDVSQQSFLALAQAKRPPSRHVAAWLHRTAYRAALDIIRSRTRRNARDLEYSTTQPAAASAAWDDVCELLDDAVAALPADCREPLVRYFFEQETHAAIAASLGIPRQTVTHRIGSGIALVRQRLKEKGVVAPAGAALAALIHENTATAMPASAVVKLGQISLAATPSVWAAMATCTMGTAFKAAAAVIVVGVSAVAGTVFNAPSRETAPAAVSTPNAPSARESETVLETGPANGGGESLTPSAPTVESVTATSLQAGAESSAPGAISGMVTFPDGRPFAGAIIHLENATRRDALNVPAGVLSTDSVIQVSEVAYSVPGNHFEATADSAGRFGIADVAPGEYVVIVKDPDFGEYTPIYENTRFTLSPDERKDNLKLVYGSEGELTVSGLVTNSAGEPVPGVRVRSIRPVPRIARSDSNGNFTLHYFPESDVVLLAYESQSYYGTAESTPMYCSDPVTARAGDQDVRVVLLKAGTVEGRIIDAKTRHPITAFYAGQLPGRHSSVRGSIFDRMPPYEDAGGNFSLGLMRVGDATIIAQAPGYLPGFLPVTMAEGERLTGLVLELERANRILAGRVVSEDGGSVTGANIYLDDVPAPGRSGRRESSVAAVTGASGEFTIENAPETVQFLGVWHPDFAPGGSEPSGNTTIVLRKAGRLHVEILSAGMPLPDVRIIAAYRGAPGERYNATSTRATTDADGRAVVEEIMPGMVDVMFMLPSKRTRRTMLAFNPGEEKTLRMEIAPAVASVDGTVHENGAPAAEGSVELHIETESGPETLLQSINQDGTFRFADVPLGAAQLVVDTGESAGRVFLDDVPLTAGEVTTLAIDASMAARISGAVSGVREDEYTELAVMPGAMGLDEAIAAADPRSMQDAVANFVGVDQAGTYDAPLHNPGIYTLLLLTFPKEAQWRREYHEARVVEVPESGELSVDFNLTP